MLSSFFLFPALNECSRVFILCAQCLVLFFCEYRQNIVSVNRKMVGNKSDRTGMSSEGQRRGESSTNVLPVALAQTLTILSNVIMPSTSDVNETSSARVEAPLQLAYTGQTGASTSAISDDLLPVLHLTEGDLPDYDLNISLLSEFESISKSAALEANVPISNIKQNIENGTNATNVEDYRLAERMDDLFGLSPLTPVPALLTPLREEDSGDEFEPKKFKSSSASSSLKGKAKTTVSQVGIGSFGKGALLKSKNTQKKTDNSPAKSHSKSPNTENDDRPILMRILTAPPKKCNKSGSKINNRGTKGDAVTSVKPVGNIAGSSGFRSTVLPAPPVIRDPIVHVIDSDVESEVFSQASDNDTLRSFRQLRDRVKREYSENLANVQRSEKNFKRLDEAFRIAQEARRVALETLERDRKALDKSSKKMRQFE